MKKAIIKTIFSLTHFIALFNITGTTMVSSVVFSLTPSTSIHLSPIQWDGPIQLKENSSYGLSVSNQNFQNGTPIILHEGFNDFIMRSDGAIVLKDNPTLGLTVLNQNLSSGTQIILHEGYNLWVLLTNGAIVLRDNPTLGLTVLNQNLSNGTQIILHEGYNLWTKANTAVKPKFEMKVEIECVEENDGGGVAEEIFGHLYIATPSGEYKLWELKEDAAVSINEGSIHRVPQKTILRDLKLDGVITVGGHLFEEDNGGDDDLGKADKSVSVQDILKNPVTLRYAYENTKIDVKYTLTPLQGKYITIKSVKCIIPSKGTDGATQVGIDIGIIMGSIPVAIGVAFIPSIGPELSTLVIETAIGMAIDNDFAEQYGKKHPGKDDLYLMLDDTKVWPSDEYVKVESQQTIPVGLTFLLDENASISLWEYDSGSGEDCMGTWRFNTEIKNSTISIYGEKEGSLYELTLDVVKYSQ